MDSFTQRIVKIEIHQTMVTIIVPLILAALRVAQALPEIHQEVAEAIAGVVVAVATSDENTETVI